jgi:hypothetical protein
VVWRLSWTRQGAKGKSKSAPEQVSTRGTGALI